jgi:DNA mismatch endonuclease (patch repair protein)
VIYVKKTPEQIHYNMQRVKCKNTEIELRLRKELWSRGVRYRKNVSKITGKPDIAFIGKKVAVFCDSEFWHGYDWKRQRAAIKSNRDFWIPKIERNIERDKKVNEALKAEGWTVLRFWGNEIKNNVEQCADLVIAALKERD